MPPAQEDLTPNDEPIPSKQRRNSQSTLAVPERVSRRPRSPSPIRRERGERGERGRTRHSEPAIEFHSPRDQDHDADRGRTLDHEQDRDRERNHTRDRERDRNRERDHEGYGYLANEVESLRTSPQSTSSRGHERESPHRIDRNSPPRREREHRSRALSPPNMYDYAEPRRSRSPSRRASEVTQSDGYQRRSRSEVRGEVDYERQYRGRHMMPPPAPGIDSTSLPNSPIHAGRNSPSSTPSTPRKQQRRLPQIPPSTNADKGKCLT